jgi:O-antigen ligase
MNVKTAAHRLVMSSFGATIAGLAVFYVVFLFLGQQVPLTLAAFVVTGLGLVILRRPEFGVYVLLFHFVASFAQYFEIPRFGPVSLPMAVQGLVLVSVLVHMAFFKKRLYVNLAQTWLLLGYALLILLSLLVADHVSPDNLVLFRKFFLLGLILYFLITHLIDSRPAFLRLVGTLIVSNVVLVISALLYHVGWLEPRIDPERLDGRVVGFIGNPNGLAFMLIGLLPLVVVLIIHVRSFWAKLFLLVLAAGNLFVILNTLSRGGFIALMAVILLMTFRVSRDRRLVALLVLLGLATYLLLPAALFERFEEIESLRGNSRYVLTMIGIRMALDNPLLGVGFGNFERYFPKYDDFHRGGSTAPHNLYTSIAAQTGIPSLMVYLVIILVSWLRLSFMMRRFRAMGSRFLWLLAVALQGGLVNVLVFGLSHHIEHYVPFWFVAASVVVLDRLYVAADRAEAPTSNGPALDETMPLVGKPA